MQKALHLKHIIKQPDKCPNLHLFNTVWLQGFIVYVNITLCLFCPRWRSGSRIVEWNGETQKKEKVWVQDHLWRNCWWGASLMKETWDTQTNYPEETITHLPIISIKEIIHTSNVYRLYILYYYCNMFFSTTKILHLCCVEKSVFIQSHPDWITYNINMRKNLLTDSHW